MRAQRRYDSARGRTLGDDGAALARRRAKQPPGGGRGLVSSPAAARAVREKMAAVALVRQRTAAATTLQSAVRGFLGRRCADRRRRTLDLRRRVEAFTASLGPATPSPPPHRARPRNAKAAKEEGASPVHIHGPRRSSSAAAPRPRNASQAARPPPRRTAALAAPERGEKQGAATAAAPPPPPQEEGPRVSLRTCEFTLGESLGGRAGAGKGLSAGGAGARGGGGERMRDVAKLRQTLNHSRLRSWGQRVEKAREQHAPGKHRPSQTGAPEGALPGRGGAALADRTNGPKAGPGRGPRAPSS